MARVLSFCRTLLDRGRRYGRSPRPQDPIPGRALPMHWQLSYAGLGYLVLPLALLRLLFLGLRDADYWRRWTERLGFAGPVPTDSRPLCLVHAVSMGELQAALPLLERLRTHYPDYRLFVTTTTPTGSRALRKTLGDAVLHSYLPYDVPFAIAKFLRRVRPKLLIVMETELWPQLFSQCRQRQIPVILANARLSERSLSRYRLLAGLFRSTLQAVGLVAAQSAQDARRYRELGVQERNIRTIGNLKCDVPLPKDWARTAQKLRHALFQDRPVWIAASTHEGEEAIVLRAARNLRLEHPDALLVLAPRHPWRCPRILSLCRRTGHAVVRRSSAAACDAATSVFLLDTLGEMSLFYGSADVVFVGGSLTPQGGHNLLEPAAFGVPLLIGPQHFNWMQPVQLLCRADAAWIVYDEQTLTARLSGLLADASGRCAAGRRAQLVVRRSRGACDLLLRELHPFFDSTLSAGA